MANLTETTTYEAGIYQLETTDPAEAGADGISNLQGKQLANRTKWIKNWIDTVKFLLFLRKGTFAIGDVIGTDDIRTVTFASVGTSNYMVNGCLISKSTNYNDDNDVFFQIREKTATSFKICLREVTGNTQNLDFDYVLIPF
jgi:hypothetical protein